MIKLPTGFSYIDEYRTDITSPAYTKPSRGEVHINHPVFDRLTPEQQDFIVLHELAHRYTEDEFMADQIAFTELMKIHNSPKIAPSALFNALSGIIPEHTQRYLQMLHTAGMYDLKENGNTKVLDVLKQIKIEPTMKIDEQTEDFVISELEKQGYTEDEILDALVDLEMADDFEGVYYASDKKAERQAKKEAKKAEKEAKKAAKKAAKEDRKQRKAEAKTRLQEAKAEKAELRNAAKQARIDRKNKLADAKANKINAKAVGIANGTYDPVGNTFKAIGDSVGGIFGGGGGDYEEKSKSSNLPLILGISGGVLVIVVIVIILVTRKK